MADQNATQIISIEAIENIKQLKDNIRELKKEVDTLTYGSEEYRTKVEELNTNQKALNVVMSGAFGNMKEVAAAANSGAKAFDGVVEAAKQGTATYREMSKALRDLKDEVKSLPKYLSEQDQALGNINPAYVELNQKIQVLDGSLKNLDADNGVFSRNVGNYLGALQEWGGTLDEVGKMGSQLTNGLLSLVGILSLFGADTEELQSSLKAIVPVFAVINGAKGLQGFAKLMPQAAKGTKAATQAVVENTTATQVNTAAQNAQTVAVEGTTAAAVTLKAVLTTLGITALIAGITALVAVVTKWASKNNKAAQETERLKKANEELTENINEQNEALELQQRIDKAKGVSNKELLQQQLDLKNSQIEQTKAVLADVQARIAQMKADSGWVRFWKGENKQIKNLTELEKELTEQLKSLNSETKSLQTDLVVDSIERGKEAAKKLTEQSEKLAKAQGDVVKDAVQKATEAIKSQWTEEKNLNEEYKKTVDLLDSGLTIVNGLISKEKDLKALAALRESRQIIENGKIAAENANEEAKARLRSKEYLEEIVKQEKERTYNNNNNFYLQEQYLRNVLGLTEKEILIWRANSTELDNNVKKYQEIGKVIENDILKFSSGVSLESLTVSGLDWSTMVKLSKTDAEKLSKNVGEPIATAIGAYVENNSNLNTAMIAAAERDFAIFEDDFERFINTRQYGKATEALDAFWKKFLLPLSEEGKNVTNDPVFAVFYKYYENLESKLAETIYNDEFEFFKESTASGLFIGSKFQNDFDITLKALDDFSSTYVASVADMLDNVGNLWEKALQMRYKKQVESGKMTQEEAEKEAEKSFNVLKGLQISVAAIDTATAIVRALADPGVPTYYLRVANAVSAAAVGAAQIATISMTEFGAPGNVKVPETSTPSYTPETQGIVYTYGINSAEYAEAAAQNPIRAYVVDRDLVEGIGAYQERENETSF